MYRVLSTQLKRRRTCIECTLHCTYTVHCTILLYLKRSELVIKTVTVLIELRFCTESKLDEFKKMKLGNVKYILLMVMEQNTLDLNSPVNEQISNIVSLPYDISKMAALSVMYTMPRYTQIQLFGLV